MALLFNINFYFDCKTRVCLIVPIAGIRKNIFAQESFYLQGIFDAIMNRTHLFLTVNTNIVELNLTNSESWFHKKNKF